jgi:hypothetical protein
LTTTEKAGLAAGAVVFCLVAVLNCGGYRYGVGDQAFYIPAVTQHLNPDLFPRDRAILHAQDRFMLYDDAIAAFVRAAGFASRLSSLRDSSWASRFCLAPSRRSDARCTRRGSAWRCWRR